MNALLPPENLQGTMMRGKRGSAWKRYQKLETDRSSFRGQWIEITDYLLPRRGRYLSESQSTKGRKRNTKILDNTGGQALRTLSAGMMSGLTSPARPWFRLMPEDPDMMDNSGVRQYLGRVERVMRGILSSSNFYNTVATMYFELGAFGTAATLRRLHPERHVHYRPYTAGEYVIAENEFGQVDTVGRDFDMTVAQIVEQFVWDPIRQDLVWSRTTKTVKNLWDRGNYDENVPVVHMIEPRRKEDRDLRRMDGLNRPFADLYFEKGADDDRLLREDGYNRLPVYAPRWDVLGGDVYGYSPGMEHLGDIKQLQHQQRRKAQAIDKMVTPPMRATTNLKGREASAMPGGVTYVDPINGQAGIEPIYTVQPRVQELGLDIAATQERIQRGFYADLFAMMINSDRRQMTATEVAERHEEKLVLLGPILQRLNSEFLDPLIEDVFLVAFQAGLLPPAPPELRNVDIQVKYVSLLAQAQEAVAASAMERTLGFAGNLAGVAPDIMDNIDTDEALREYADIMGNSPKVIREKGQRDQIRADRARQQEQAAAMEMAQQGADTARLLSETDTQTPNALTDLLGRGQSIV